jgi:hypothetical protein
MAAIASRTKKPISVMVINLIVSKIAAFIMPYQPLTTIKVRK